MAYQWLISDVAISGVAERKKGEENGGISRIGGGVAKKKLAAAHGENKSRIMAAKAARGGRKRGGESGAK